MKIIFFGTPEYVIPILKILHKHYEVVAVVSQEPKPAGRGKRTERSAVDDWAFKHKLRVDYDFDKLPPGDLGILAAFGKIIPQKIIDHFKHGILNIHPSLLPKYRGPTPVSTAILKGNSETGVSVIKIDAELDHGPIVSQFKEKIKTQDTTETLRTRLFQRSAEFLIQLIPSYVQQKIHLKPQDHARASYTSLAQKSQGFISPSDLNRALQGKGSKKINNQIRALDPWPGTWTQVRLHPSEKTSKRLKILKSHLEKQRLVLDEVQLEGKNRVRWQQFKQGYPEYEFAGS